MASWIIYCKITKRMTYLHTIDGNKAVLANYARDLLYMIADPGYDDKKLYKYSKKVLEIDLVCPVERYQNTSKKRLELVCFYQSVLGQAIYSRRRISIEPLIEHIKSMFRIDPLPARGFCKVSAIVLLSVLLYQLMVYYNCKLEKINPKSIKYMLGTG